MSKFCCKISLLNGLDLWELGAVGFGNDLRVAKSHPLQCRLIKNFAPKIWVYPRFNTW